MRISAIKVLLLLLLSRGLCWIHFLVPLPIHKMLLQSYKEDLYNTFYQGELTIIFFLAIFAGIALKCFFFQVSILSSTANVYPIILGIQYPASRGFSLAWLLAFTKSGVISLLRPKSFSTFLSFLNLVIPARFKFQKPWFAQERKISKDSGRSDIMTSSYERQDDISLKTVLEVFWNMIFNVTTV